MEFSLIILRANLTQISLFDKLAFLSRRKQQMLEKSWAQTFSDHIFTRINEHIFAPLYSEKTNSRPNAPINVVVGALILKDFSGFNDEEITAKDYDFINLRKKVGMIFQSFNLFNHLSVIDNLVKGAAGQAIQNMNIMFGLPEYEGLDLVPMFP